MTGYELSRSWFNFCFDNPEKVKPIHTAIFFFAVEHQNRLGGKQKFGFPSQMTMDAIGVKKYQTYGKALNEISEWGFIEFIERSKNQYSANIISIIATPKNGKARGKALDKAIIKHRAKQGQSTGQGKDSINKPINQLTKEPVDVEESDIYNFEVLDVNEFKDVRELQKYYLNNLRLMNAFCNVSENNLTFEELPKRLERFTKELECEGRFKETFTEYSSYFKNWNRKVPKKQKANIDEKGRLVANMPIL